MCMSIGGWGDTAGFSVAAADGPSRELYARNVNQTLAEHGYDCVDIDWEYPGGDGEDYKQHPDAVKVGEKATYPLLLQAIRDAIDGKELTIAVPGLERSMIAFTADQVPKINDIVDVVNWHGFRRTTTTTHHTSVQGSLESVQRYIDRGIDPAKINIGFAFYAKYFPTTGPCPQGLGCPVVALEDLVTGADSGLSGAVTFQQGNAMFSKGKADETAGGQYYWDSDTKYFWTWDTPEFIAQKFVKS
ncbi:Uu.00g095040.m01.CDS01 [Anthostomella pinea]|uniref:chitinase n=1 Tax=Anthostomella pinea TaxID=933095 RepID=A0AAI8VIB1_9PEZI|nr:Uu.00g095040.m01.CDS01 [Anthostomella pinea]